MKGLITLVCPVWLLVCCSWQGHAQAYAPAAEQPGSTAFNKDSTAFVAWAKNCTVQRGMQDLSNISLGLTSSGDASLAIGKADVAGVVSLGDGGNAVCTFEYPITNGPGFDFAVFENSFSDDFLELAFVEVSSDGVNFFKFPNNSLSDTINQCGTFGTTDATKINNLAGKYRGGFGTPFDLQELSSIQGLDINRITHVKVIDVVGSLDSKYAQRDSHQNKINDPWPTPFPSGGFDLDAVGVMHQAIAQSIAQLQQQQQNVRLMPNPVAQNQNVTIQSNASVEMLRVYNHFGQLVMQTEGPVLSTAALIPGLYYVEVKTQNLVSVQKLLVE